MRGSLNMHLLSVWTSRWWTEFLMAVIVDGYSVGCVTVIRISVGCVRVIKNLERVLTLLVGCVTVIHFLLAV